jgi:hypothetical protein
LAIWFVGVMVLLVEQGFKLARGDYPFVSCWCFLQQRNSIAGQLPC